MDETLSRLRCRALVPGLIALVAGCGTTKIVQYAEPMPQRIAAPSHVDLSDVSPPWKRQIDPVAAAAAAVPLASDPKPEPEEPPKSPADLIREANQDAYTPPGEGEAVGHTQVYVYSPDREYPIYACAKETVQIRLAVHETMPKGSEVVWASDPVFGPDGKKIAEKRWWTTDSITSGDGHGQAIQVILLRANAKKAARTRMQIFTNVGPYTFDLNVVSDEQCMRAVRFRHPQHELNQMALDAEQVEATTARVAAKSGDGCTSSAYDFEVKEGSPRWVPTLVWRECSGDRAQVHIQFRGDVAWRKVPSLQTDGGVADYAYDPAQKVMTVHGLFNHARLQLGSKEQGYEVVLIHALKEPSR